MSIFPKLILAGGLVVGAAIAVAASGNAEPAVETETSAADPALLAAGEKSYAANCAECHSIAKGERDMMGPNLWGMMGRKLGARPEFTFSDAMHDSQLIWTPENLDKWIESPPTFLPDNAMPFIGIADAAERRALVAYIAKRSSEE